MEKPKDAELKEDPEFEIRFLEGIVKQVPHYLEALAVLAENYTRGGEYKKGLELDLKICRLSKEDPVAHYNLACSYSLVGDKEKALETLEHAIGLGYSDAAHMKKDPDLKPLHQEPMFQKLLKRISQY